MTPDTSRFSHFSVNSPTQTQNGTDQTALFKCNQCSPPLARGSAKPSRNLIVCIDGTSNQFGQNNTNVVKLFAKIDLETVEPQQFAYYSSGIGTRPKSINIFDRMGRAVSDKFDMAVAWNMEEIVKDAYGWLARTYQEGDKIYLFGFSRGAYQVRVLAGMIHEVGLIRTPTEKQIGTAYDHYESIRSGKPKTRQIAREFKNTFSWKGLRVHFIGVWDTVSSVGLIRGDVFLSTSSSAAHACHFRHALALDELRVKFMPEYFHEMNSESADAKSKYVDAILGAKRPATTNEDPHTSDTKSQRVGSSHGVAQSPIAPSERQSRISSASTGTANCSTPDIEEVWFAGSHSDVGGRNRPGKAPQAGNVSLLWMRREAVAKGLVLHPTDVVWVPDDLDLGTSDSMSRVWRAIEYLPIKHQVCFSSGGGDARRVHALRPRRIIPGQKVHASILYANAYKPHATLGEGFDIPMTHSELDDADLDNEIWETGLFDDTAAQELVNSLDGEQGVAPVYLDRLLFMLRFNEGKQCVRNVPGWQDKFERVIENPKCAPLVRLVTMVSYYEGCCDSQPHPQTLRHTLKVPSDEAFADARSCLVGILEKHKHRDGPRVVSLLRPLTKHKDMRDHFLTQDVLDSLVNLLDKIVGRQEGNFGQAMDGLSSLLRCEDTQKIIISKLGENYPDSNMTRLSRILKVEDPLSLIAALRMVTTLARIPSAEAKNVCVSVKPRLGDLAQKSERLVGVLAVEVLLALYDESEGPAHLKLRDQNVRANLASALVRMNFDTDQSGRGETSSADPARQELSRIFGLHEGELTDNRRRLIGELKSAVQSMKARERTAATMTILKLCDSPVIREYFRDIHLLDVWIEQLQDKNAALLAAYALTICLKYKDMEEPIKNNALFPKYIVGMLRLNYFDDAMGQIEGFQIFGNIMRDDDLRAKIQEYRISDVLEDKLGTGKSREIRTSLICLEIVRCFEQDASSARKLVKTSLIRLRHAEWKVQKIGVTILSALAQTKHGMEAITPRILETIIEMLLPEGYLPLRTEQESTEANPASPASPGGGQVQPAATMELADNNVMASGDALSENPSWMMGPACALRILAQNKDLRECIGKTIQYGSLKHLYLSGMLVGEKDTSAWRIGTPNRTDVTGTLDRIIKAVDGEQSEEGLSSVGDTMLPNIRHWDRLVTVVRDRTLGVITILPGILGVSVLAAAVTPIYLSLQAYGLLERVWARYQNIRFLNGLHVPVPRNIVSGLVTAVRSQGQSHPIELSEGEGSGQSGQVVESPPDIETTAG